MQDFIRKNDKQKAASLQQFSVDEQQKLVGAFVWLIEQDKKQNPAFYQRNTKHNDRHNMPTHSER